MYEQRADFAHKTYKAVEEKVFAEVDLSEASPEMVEQQTMVALGLTQALLVSDAIRDTLGDIGPGIVAGCKEIAGEIDQASRR
jgi:hypothetical protein